MSKSYISAKEREERIREIDDRLVQIRSTVENDNTADLDTLLEETKALQVERDDLGEQQEKNKMLRSCLPTGLNGNLGVSVQEYIESRTNPSEALKSQKKALDYADKTHFRSGEKIADKYPADINIEKCFRAAITGNYKRMNDAERSAVTPETGGAMLAPEVTAQFIDNLRQTDWMEVFRPTFVMMGEGETKIPKIERLPTAIMHTPGTEQTPSEPIIEAAYLRAKTFMVLVEVANELLHDAPSSHNVITEACRSALSNKLLQQTLYGTGKGPEVKGITKYNTSSFADAGPRLDEVDLYRLATTAKVAIINNNGMMDAMLYDTSLEDRLNKRLHTGELVQPSRAFAELHAAGRVLPHPSVAKGDMFFIQSDMLYIGMREQFRLEVDRSTAFNSNNTVFRLILRADIFANVARMVYYSDIPAIEPDAT